MKRNEQNLKTDIGPLEEKIEGLEKRLKEQKVRAKEAAADERAVEKAKQKVAELEKGCYFFTFSRWLTSMSCCLAVEVIPLSLLPYSSPLLFGFLLKIITTSKSEICAQICDVKGSANDSKTFSV